MNNHFKNLTFLFLFFAIIYSCKNPNPNQEDNAVIETIEKDNETGIKDVSLDALFKSPSSNSISIYSLEHLDVEENYPFTGQAISDKYKPFFSEKLHDLFFNDIDNSYSVYKIERELPADEIYIFRVPYGNWSSSIQICLRNMETGQIDQCVEAGQFYGDDGYTYEKKANFHKGKLGQSYQLTIWKEDCSADDKYENIECTDSVFQYFISKDNIKKISAIQEHVTSQKHDLKEVMDIKEFDHNFAPPADSIHKDKLQDTHYYGDYIIRAQKTSELNATVNNLSIYLKGMDLKEKPLFDIGMHWNIMNKTNWEFEGMYKDFLILDTGTSVQGRQLFARDVTSKKQYAFYHSGSVKISDNKLYYYTTTDFDESLIDDLCDPIITNPYFLRLMIFDFETKKQIETGQVICMLNE